MESSSNKDSDWTTVIKRNIVRPTVTTSVTETTQTGKINQPCWFYNTGGCKNKDGTPKNEEDCRYLHVISPNLAKPVHINPTKPCDKFNLEGYCKFGDFCKYSHRNLTQEEWEKIYQNIPYKLKNNNQRRQLQELSIQELESRINILEYKLKSMDEHYETKFKNLEARLKIMTSYNT